jgi:LysM repeat protein
MFKKVTIIAANAISAVVLLSACFRSASPPILAKPAVIGSSSTSQPTSMSLMQAWGTTTAVYVQTAVAQGTFTVAPASETPQPNPTSTQPGTVSTPVVPATGVATNTPMPGTTPFVIVPTATPGRPGTYTLQKGEFPYCIARRFNVDPGDLLSVNGLSTGEILQPGLILKIPQTGSFPGSRALTPHPAQYAVAVDDTIYGIACHFGDVDPSSIAAANGLSLSAKLVTGKILYIP